MMIKLRNDLKQEKSRNLFICCLVTKYATSAVASCGREGAIQTMFQCSNPRPWLIWSIAFQLLLRYPSVVHLDWLFSFWDVHWNSLGRSMFLSSVKIWSAVIQDNLYLLPSSQSVLANVCPDVLHPFTYPKFNSQEACGRHWVKQCMQGACILFNLWNCGGSIWATCCPRTKICGEYRICCRPICPASVLSLLCQKVSSSP